MASPTVFNFYLPDHQPVGEITNQGLVAPEFSLHNTRTAIGYINKVNQWFVWNDPWWTWENEIGDVHPSINFTPYLEMMYDKEEMINYMDVVFTHGQMTDDTRTNLRETLKPFQNTNLENLVYRFQMAAYLTLISPDFNIFK